jgi:CheY-like chemotaxis protein
MLRLSVADTGSGISPEYSSQIFEPFNRLGREGGEIEGTGVGLAITKQLVEAMGGRIGYRSAFEVGSVFWVELPGKQTNTPDTYEKVDDSDGVESWVSTAINATILYIEDNQANTNLMKKIAGRFEGLELLTAPNAELGLSMAKGRLPDLILMDIYLPGMGGYAAFKALRAIDATKDIPVIAISAAATNIDIKNGLAAGFKDYLIKPLDINKLVGAIKKELDTRVFRIPCHWHSLNIQHVV